MNIHLTNRRIRQSYACGRRWDWLRSTACQASVCSTMAIPQSPYCPLSEAETRRSRLTHASCRYHMAPMQRCYW